MKIGLKETSGMRKQELQLINTKTHSIKKSGILHKTSNIHAFVVGCEIGDIDVHKVSDSGTVDVLTYGHLVETANVKLFGLKKTLEEHYNSFNDESLVEKALKEPAQLKMKL